MTPAGQTLLGAMRRNVELLAELEKSQPADVAVIVEALVAHLRSWKPMAATSIPVSLDSAPFALVDPPVDPVASIRRELADGAHYQLSRVAVHDVVLLHIFDGGDDAAIGLSPDQARTLRDDVARVMAGR